MEQENNLNDTIRTKNETMEWIKALVIAAVLVLLIRFFIFAPFIVEGPSMQPNFETGERLIVNKILFSIRSPKRGEVIVFHATPEKDYIKRVIALPGETVKVEGDSVFINGKKLDETYIKAPLDEAVKNGTIYNTLKDFPESKVPEGMLFVMGDNRPNSSDSRTIGFVSIKKVVGRSDLVFWPFKEFKFVKH